MAEDNHNLPPSNHSGTSPSAMFLEMMRQAAARRAEAEEGYSVEPEPEMTFHDLNFQLTPDTSDPIIEANTDENDVVDSDIKEDSFLVEAEQDNDIDVAILPTPEKIKPFIEATLVGHDSTNKIMSSEKSLSEREGHLSKKDSISEVAEDAIESPTFEEDIEEEPTYLRGRVPIYTAPDEAKADEIAAKMEEQRIRRIKRRQQRQQKRRVGILGGFVRTALITIISAVLASTIFTWFTDPEFFTSNVVSGLQVANATSVAVIDPLTPTVLAVTPNWARRIGIVSGHRGPENDPGAVCPDGLTEREINFAVAQLVVLGLRENGYSVDLLDEFDPRLDAYQAAALVSIHANDCQDYGEYVSGYLVARAAARPAGGFDDILAECIARDYGKAVDIERRFSLTVDMTDYHTFREINSLTPAAILELGFMRADRDLLVNQQDLIASGIIEGILCFLNGETPFEAPTESPTPLPLDEPTATGE